MGIQSINLFFDDGLPAMNAIKDRFQALTGLALSSRFQAPAVMPGEPTIIFAVDAFYPIHLVSHTGDGRTHWLECKIGGHYFYRVLQKTLLDLGARTVDPDSRERPSRAALRPWQAYDEAERPEK